MDTLMELSYKKKMISLQNQIALVTGASSGIGYAIAESLAEKGCSLALGARRIEKLKILSTELEKKYSVRVFTGSLDVTSTESVNQFVSQAKQALGYGSILINNAGLARGVDYLADGKDADWQAMLDTNVSGVLKTTRAALKTFFDEKKGGHIINLGSVAGFLVYEGGSVYTASKHALRAITGCLRLELLGKPFRVTSVDPGMVDTEFSEVRFSGDKTRADLVYQGMTPLKAIDIAECVVFAASQPPHVNIDQIVVAPRDQAFLKVNRNS